MYKTTIKRKGRTDIHLEYDNEKYNIEYIEHKNILILRRLEDNKVLDIFEDRIGFIIQHDENDITNFLVTFFSKKEEEKVGKFKHYYIYNDFLDDEIKLGNELECAYPQLSQCRITNSAYRVGDTYRGGKIYNLNNLSKRFQEVYIDEKLNKYFSDNTILVCEEKHSYYNYDISDTITYGINPETFEITTPIWSEMQQRYIKPYTKKQIEEMNKKTYLSRQINIKDFSLGEITIYLEIQEALEKIAKYFDKSQSVYYYEGANDIVNEKFVKKLARK